MNRESATKMQDGRLGFDSWSGETKILKIGICSFPAGHLTVWHSELKETVPGLKLPVLRPTSSVVDGWAGGNLTRKLQGTVPSLSPSQDNLMKKQETYKIYCNCSYKSSSNMYVLCRLSCLVIHQFLVNQELPFPNFSNYSVYL